MLKVSPGGLVGNMLAWHTVNGSEGYISDSDDHCNGGPVSLDPQLYIKEPWRGYLQARSKL